ncbi:MULTISPECIES: hypothetical protein [unclassified Lysobacter]|uniref:hypothetical protein n=1 Tax=unclassified Lysobacter TaxID=2635362 RepID=UPI001BE55826|nr:MULTISPECIES: hypothetical protein [unclassified Lysobacter]MBT2748287.1 hypothetical protein [Lysobacter sp. ISL-42]MBT2749946.1 hypothetical protein [Lysobacter sp. ISL-50]MBT2781274.1 hypothetical protein [Lysobacter sp. ISL-52]
MSLHSDTAASDVVAHLQQQIEAAIALAADDIGAVLAPSVVTAWAELRSLDPGAFVRLRQQVKRVSPAFPVAELERAMRREVSAEGERDPTALDALVQLARSRCDLVHDADRNAVAIITMPDHRQVWRVHSAGFSDWLRALWWAEKQAGLQETLLKAALATLAAAGLHEGEQVEVHLRAARGDDGYYIDLCDAKWRVVYVCATGWDLLDHAPILFTRTSAMRPLPEPDPNHGGLSDLARLWEHVNVRPEQQVLVLTWLLDCLRADTPFPVLELIGEQGSAKSTTQSVLRSLIDPNKVLLRGRPKTVEDIFVAAANNWMVSYENLSGLTPEQQDTLCTLATGGGFAARQLFTNGEEHVLETKRPAVLNGIAVVATRPDLIDRVVHIDMPVIDSAARKDDAQAKAAWDRDRARVFAGLLDLFGLVLERLPTIRLKHKQRMADFERLGEAVSRALGHPAGRFQSQYAELVHAGVDRALDGNPVAQALDKFLRKEVLPWTGTAGALYEQLNHVSGSDRSAWPRSPKGLADQLRRVAPAYRTKGIEIENRGHTRDGAVWRVSRRPGRAVETEIPLSASADATRLELDAAESAAHPTLHS